MAKDYIGYETLADDALRTVVREALKGVVKKGLVGAHHFFLTFKTHDPGVDIPSFLKERYPDEMTIVLQKQFWDLKAEEDHFEVTLTFQKVPATLTVPYAAMTAFVDPGVQFGLQFRNSSAKAQDGAVIPPPPAPRPEEKKPALAKDTDETPEAAGGDQANQVVSLDKFRKK